MATSTSWRGTHIPAPLDRLVGRESELDLLHGLLSSGARLITLVGPGGVGKTRLALEACRREADSYPDGAALVTLEAITDADDVLPEIARALGIELRGVNTPLNDLVAALSQKQLLLCVDNWEHLIEAGNQIVPLLERCLGVQMIATSREALRLRGEQMVVVEPLQLPLPRATADVLSAAAAPAVQLFVERARAVRPSFNLEEKNAPAVVEICSLLDGLPLAIELTAALVRLFSLDALLSQLKQKLSFAAHWNSRESVASGPRDLPHRQRTLRAAIDWSYTLLDRDEQRVFRQMAVFGGGCDVNAVEAVCQLDSAGPVTPLAALIALVDKSLIRVRDEMGESRFSMLRTIQDFALDQLTAEGESLEAHARHAAHYHQLAERLAVQVGSKYTEEKLSQLSIEYDNCRLALVWFLEHGQAQEVHELCNRLWRYWYWRGLAVEGLLWLEKALSLQGEVHAWLWSETLYAASVLALQTDNFTAARRYAHECASLRSVNQDPKNTSVALRQLAVVEFLQNDLDQALHHLQESLALCEAAGYEQEVAESHLKLGWILYFMRDYPRAMDHVLKALDIFAPNANAVQLSDCWHLLGDITAAQTKYEEAEGWLEKARSTVSTSIANYDTVEIDLSRGRLALTRGNLVPARNILSKCLAEASDLHDAYILTSTLETFACLMVSEERPLAAAKLWGACEAARKRLSLPGLPHNQAFCDRYMATTRTRLGMEVYHAQNLAGLDTTLDEAVRLALDPSPVNEDEPRPTGVRRGYPAGLTPREVEVLSLVTQGLSDKEIAEQLVVSPRTVNAHLTSIYSKLSVNSRVAATRAAIELGLAS